jgi:RND superfamily putative drug exporter
LADQTISAMTSDMVRVGLVVLAINFLLLAIFLRALLAPLFLLASSVLNVAATLGLTAWVFQGILGYGELTYYVPFVVAVLLVSLGSDYNIFVVGRVWQEARIRPIREAVAVAAPRASRAIRIAGITLAASFGVLALIPLRSFREIAFAMATGVLLETFVVRALLAPALIALFGHTSVWPRHLQYGEPVSAEQPAGTSPPTAHEPESRGVEHADQLDRQAGARVPAHRRE